MAKKLNTLDPSEYDELMTTLDGIRANIREQKFGDDARAISDRMSMYIERKGYVRFIRGKGDRVLSDTGYEVLSYLDEGYGEYLKQKDYKAQVNKLQAKQLKFRLLTFIAAGGIAIISASLPIVADRMLPRKADTIPVRILNYPTTPDTTKILTIDSPIDTALRQDSIPNH